MFIPIRYEAQDAPKSLSDKRTASSLKPWWFVNNTTSVKVFASYRSRHTTNFYQIELVLARITFFQRWISHHYRKVHNSKHQTAIQLPHVRSEIPRRTNGLQQHNHITCKWKILRLHLVNTLLPQAISTPHFHSRISISAQAAIQTAIPHLAQTPVPTHHTSTTQTPWTHPIPPYLAPDPQSFVSKIKKAGRDTDRVATEYETRTAAMSGHHQAPNGSSTPNAQVMSADDIEKSAPSTAQNAHVIPQLRTPHPRSLHYQHDLLPRMANRP